MYLGQDEHAAPAHEPAAIDIDFAPAESAPDPASDFVSAPAPGIAPMVFAPSDVGLLPVMEEDDDSGWRGPILKSGVTWSDELGGDLEEFASGVTWSDEESGDVAGVSERGEPAVLGLLSLLLLLL